MAIDHEAGKVGAADITHMLVSKSQNLILRSSVGAQAALSVDNDGNVSISGGGIVTVPSLNSWSPLSLKLNDANGASMSFPSNTSGALQ